MFLCDQWKDYEVLDTGDGEKLERWKDVILRRPDPQVIWPKADPTLWKQADAWYTRSETGGGNWTFYRKLPERWVMTLGDLQFYVRPTGFKHTGLFPEQAANWAFMRERVAQATARGKQVRVLNLFAYTGAATLACAAAGAHVTHVDAAKGMVQWAKENRDLSGIPEDRTRMIVEDVKAFVQRELRRGNRYEGILMDPPSYGRGPNGEVWKLENELYGLVELCVQAVSDQPVFFLVNGYTTGFAGGVLANIVSRCFAGRGHTVAEELALPVTTGGVLPCGATARWTPDV
ncbi:MAG TPA: class I SAM-dependent methyltransferase [Candidatus Limiplasma sp.]|nr:class I SAM-dependent methyltransferase [Candidatus Limiplasma sp.]HPS81100.1 class I SAM-dependent methyltransferase [Candidatus Limiplasma sp.]